MDTAARARPDERTLLVTLVLVQVAFGGLAVASKFALPFVPPLALAFCRLASAAVVLVALERIAVRSKMPPMRDVAKFALFALLGVVLNQGLFLTGLKYTTATNAVLLIATIPAFTLLLAVLFGHEKARPVKLAGLALSFGGVAVLVFGKGARFGGNDLFGRSYCSDEQQCCPGCGGEAFGADWGAGDGQ